MSPANNGILSSDRPPRPDEPTPPPMRPIGWQTGPAPPQIELQRSLADIKGQAQFLLYLADQIEDSLEQLVSEADACHSAFLCKVLGMYSGQLESKHQGLGEKIAEACQEVYVTVRKREVS